MKTSSHLAGELLAARALWPVSSSFGHDAPFEKPERERAELERS